MNAIEARNKVRLKNNSQNNFKDELQIIREKIKQAVEFGWNDTFISNFNISVENKTILENDGYFVDTSYTSGFQIRWMETDMNYFLDLIKRNKEHAKLNVSDEVIDNYKRSAFTDETTGLQILDGLTNTNKLQQPTG